MKVTFTVGFDVANDWDEIAFRGGDPDGRKTFIGSALRAGLSQAAMLSLASSVGRIGVCGVSVSEATWDGWDNAKIAAAIGLTGEEATSADR